MAETFITQCPHCSTSFRITDEHLAVANGSVRCGACLQVFSARSHLLNGKLKTKPSDPPRPAAKTQPQSSAASQQSDDDDFLFEDDPNDNFEEFIFSDDDLLGEDSNDELDELSDAFWDLSDDAPQRPTEPKPAAKAEPAPAKNDSESAFDISTDDEADEPESSWMVDEDDESYDDEAEPGARENHATQLAQQLSTTDFDFTDEPPQRGRRWLGLAVIALLLVTLAGELAWWQKDRYARLDPWRGLYQSACNLLGCELPPQQDLTNVKPSNVLVRNHPTVENVRLLDAILTNQAPFRQPFPTLILEYTDINGERVADQAFTPDDYLRGELTGIKLMPTNTRIYVSIPFRDPGSEAINYQLRTAPGPG
ncbi:DUF3426 domain-containing protein [Saccharospirillum sp. MSK14-1]|uniref:DUF3426 domain-containing protein n=1 Tax=Saccharospirillum sp. MSK14-1 TaxID=1897632 RepID=UPI001304F290|nr:DUF3426 domain-containing protein [Saccharospirillum sp. MSK14-1]